MSKDTKNAIYNEKLPSGLPWAGVIKKGQTFRIVDLEGCQAVDTLFYNNDNLNDRYSANDTIREQYRDKFRDYLGQRLSKERPLSGIRYIERVIYGYVSDE